MGEVLAAADRLRRSRAGEDLPAWTEPGQGADSKPARLAGSTDRRAVSLAGSTDGRPARSAGSTVSLIRPVSSKPPGDSPTADALGENAPAENPLGEDVPTGNPPADGGLGEGAPTEDLPAEDALAEDSLGEDELCAAERAVQRGAGEVMSVRQMAGHVRMSPGPALAAWLGQAEPGTLDEAGLVNSVTGWRKITSWAQAQELAAVAEIARRRGVMDDPEVERDPARELEADFAPGEVALALTLTQCAAEWWMSLAVNLARRLPATWAALSDGTIDLGRAKLIDSWTTPLDDELARAVERKVLVRSGQQTTGQLRASLQRAVISVDPAAAERRRAEAEKNARVELAGEDSGTAALSGHFLPAAQASAAWARISAMAKAMAANGAGGGIDLLRAQVFVGLLLGNPPQPGHGTSGSGRPDDDKPGDAGPGTEPGNDDPGEEGPGEEGPGGESGSHVHDEDRPGDVGPGDDDPAGDRFGDDDPGEDRLGDEADDDDPRDQAGDHAPGQDDPDGEPDEDRPGDKPGHADPGGEPGHAGPRGEPGHGRPGIEPGSEPWRWPPLAAPGQVPWPDSLSGEGAISRSALSVPWRTLAGRCDEPGQLTRMGAVTAGVARELAQAAATDATCEWRVIVTDAGGQVVAVSRIRSPGRTRGGSGDPPRPGVLGRITVTVPTTILAEPSPAEGLAAGSALNTALQGIVSAARAAVREASPATPRPSTRGNSTRGNSTGGASTGGNNARDRSSGGNNARGNNAGGGTASGDSTSGDATVTAAAGDGTRSDSTNACNHEAAVPGYRIPERMRAVIEARDQDCGFPICRRPATQCDLDHTVPYDQGGLTCTCNLSGECRRHHRMKGLTPWRLRQPRPGTLSWTAPSGLSWTVTPEPHAA